MCRLLGPGDGVDEVPRCAWPVVTRLSSRAVAQSSSHERSTPSINQRQPFPADALAVERLRAQAALAQRIVDDADAVGEELFAHLVAQEACLAGDGSAVHGAGKMADDGAGNATVEYDGHLAGRHLARIEPRDGAFAGGAADFFRAVEICGVQRRGIFVVAFHAGAVAGDRLHRDAMARAEIGAVEAVAGHQHHAADAGGGRGAARLGDAGDGKSRLFHRARGFFQRGNARQIGIAEIEVGEIMRQQARIGEPGISVLGRHASHGDRAFGELRGAIGGQVVGGNHRLAAADQHAQAKVVAFGALAFLNGAVADLDGQRHRAQRDRVGGIGAGGARGLHQAFGAFGEGGLVEERRGGGMHGAVNGSDNEERSTPLSAICAAAATPRQSCLARRRQS